MTSYDACVLAVIALLMYLDIVAAQPCSEVTCMSCDTEALVLSCPQGHKVTGSVLAGFRDSIRGNLSYCGHLEDDCLAEEAYSLNQILSCMWHSNYCQFNLDPFFTIPVLPNNCQAGVLLKAKYFIATDVECFPSENIHVLCQSRSRLLIAHNASVIQFLTSVDFPRQYAQYKGVDVMDHLCGVEIRAPTGQGIHIESVSMDISGPNKDGTCTKEHLKLWDPDNNFGDVMDHVFCGHTNFSLDWPISGLMVEFVTENLDPVTAKTKRGFALKYHRYDIPTFETPSQPTIEPSTQPTKSEDTENKLPSPESLSMSDDPVLPRTILVVVIVMAFVFLVAVVTAVGVLVWRRDHTRATYDPTGSIESIEHGHV